MGNASRLGKNSGAPDGSHARVMALNMSFEVMRRMVGYFEENKKG
jgi:hypothetical protein